MASRWMAALAAAGLLTWTGYAVAGFEKPPPEHLRAHVAALREADAVVGDEARCAAHPDLPGNAWREGAARARCTLLREPKFSLDEIAAILDMPGGADRLEREFAALLDAHYVDQLQREQIFRSLVPFDKSRLARAVSDRWLAAAPDSAFALAASASHYGGLGWQARGEEFINEVSAERKATMAEAMTKAVPLYARALEISPRLTPACVGLMDIGRQLSAELEERITPVCIGMDPDSYHVAWALIRAALPRWGGSRDAMTNAVAYAAARVGRNPIMGALMGEAAADALLHTSAGMKLPSEVAGQLAEVARMAPSGTIIAQAGTGYDVRGDHWPALVHLSQGLRFWPMNAEWRRRRARVLMDLGDYAWAEREVDIAIGLDDSQGWAYYTKGLIQRRAGRGEALARPHLERAMKDPRSRRHAYQELCAGYLTEGAMEQADACTRALVAEDPEVGEGWYMREWLLTKTGGDGLQDARRELLDHGSPDDPRHAARMQELRAMRMD